MHADAAAPGRPAQRVRACRAPMQRAQLGPPVQTTWRTCASHVAARGRMPQPMPQRPSPYRTPEPEGRAFRCTSSATAHSSAQRCSGAAPRRGARQSSAYAVWYVFTAVAQSARNSASAAACGAGAPGPVGALPPALRRRVRPARTDAQPAADERLLGSFLTAWMHLTGHIACRVHSGLGRRSASRRPRSPAPERAQQARPAGAAAGGARAHGGARAP
jgi:hypothetical protein